MHQLVKPIVQFVTLALLPLVSHAAGPGNNVEFSLRMTMTAVGDSQDDMAMDMNYYVGKNRIRIEAVALGKVQSTVITLFDNNLVTTYTLIPQGKAYTVANTDLRGYYSSGGMFFGDPKDATHPCQMNPRASCTKVGTDTILGREVEQWTVRGTNYWLDREMRWPLRVRSPEFVLEATTVEVGAQNDALFSPPDDYEVMSVDL